MLFPASGRFCGVKRVLTDEIQTQSGPKAESGMRISPALVARPAGFWPREAIVTGWLIALAGAVFRVRSWLHWRSLWLDEIYLAHSVVTRDLRGLLLRPLDYWQAAPAGFLVLQRWCVDLFGAGERSLRLASLLASLASLPLFFALARKLLSLRGTLLAMVLFSCLAPLVYYAQEAKQYSLDVFFSIAILYSATLVWGDPKSVKKRLTFAIIGAPGIFFSICSIFVLAGAAVVLIVGRIVQTKRVSAALPMALALLVWVALEVLNVRVFLQPLMHGPQRDGLYKYWLTAGAFPPPTPDLFFAWVWKSVRGIIGSYETMYISGSELGMFLVLVGAAGLIIAKRTWVAMLLLSPLPMGVAAALLRKYPFGDRLALYLVPSLALLMAAGIDFLWGKEDGKRTMLGMLLAVMLIGGSVARCVYVYRNPDGREETREAFDWIRRNWRAGDMILVSKLTVPSFDYYAPKTGMAGLKQLWEAPPSAGPNWPGLLESSAQGIAAMPWLDAALRPINAPSNEQGYLFVQADHTDHPGLYLDEIDGLFSPRPQWGWPPVKRVWVVFAHDWDEHLGEICLPELNRKAQQMIRHSEEGVETYLYQVTDRPTDYILQSGN